MKKLDHAFPSFQDSPHENGNTLSAPLISHPDQIYKGTGRKNTLTPRNVKQRHHAFHSKSNIDTYLDPIPLPQSEKKQKPFTLKRKHML